MADSNAHYLQLAKSRSGLNGLGALYLAPDHLLLVRNIFAVEQYRRWYFKDIQALLVRRTAKRLIWNIVIGGGGFFLTVAAIASLVAPANASDDRMVLTVFGVFFAVLALGCLAVTIINSALGPGCNVYIQTAHRLEKLPLPGRLATFRAISARVEPLIVAAQGGAAQDSGAAPPEGMGSLSPK